MKTTKLDIANVNTNFELLNATKTKVIEDTNDGIKKVINKIIEKIEDKVAKGNSYKQSRKDVKEELMQPLYKTVTTKNGKQIEKLVAHKNTLRAYNIAFTIIFRNIVGVENKTELSVAQIETVATYFTINEVNELMEYQGDALITAYKEIASNYKKVVSSKVLDTKHKKVSAK